LTTPRAIITSRLSVLLTLASCVALSGCHAGSHAGADPYAPRSESARDPLEAQRLTLLAAELLEHDDAALDSAKLEHLKIKTPAPKTDASGRPLLPRPDLVEAEKLLRQALGADLYHGPAHNDLLYEAAGEFEWARKLMPGHPDPRMNLALTLERAGRYDDALHTYASALEVYPGHIPTLEALTRLQLRHARPDEHTLDHLATLATDGESPQWREWAQKQLSKTP
jgi:tetratricopeptide (TPR) repeat protein